MATISKETKGLITTVLTMAVIPLATVVGTGMFYLGTLTDEPLWICIFGGVFAFLVTIFCAGFIAAFSG